MNPQTDVTAENYTAKVRLFLGSADKDASFGVMINPIDHPHEWGAWRSYFQAIGRPTAYFDELGRIAALTARREDRLASASYLVPARMPSDFDADREFLYDSRAGEAFYDAQREASASAGRLAERGPERAEFVRRILSGERRTHAPASQHREKEDAL